MADLDSVKVRDTLDILWSSLATIITCTYTILHPTVPEQRQGRDPGRWGDIKWSPFWRSLKWSFITVLCPEYILAGSMMDWWKARKLLRRLYNSKPETKGVWTFTHMLFAQMGGFAVEVRSVSKPELTHTTTRSLGTGPGDEEEGKVRVNPPKLYHLPAGTVTEAVINGLLSPEVCSLDEILDRSKSTLFTKILTLGQTSYFLVQFFVRLGEGLPTTPLELGVVGFVVCAILTYFFVLSTPKDVAIVIKLASFEVALPVEIEQSARRERDGQSIEHHIKWDDSTDSNKAGCLVLMLGTLVGAIHLAGWNLDYPTITDAWLWRGAALWTTVVLFIYFAWFIAGFIGTDGFGFNAGMLLVCSYVIARLILLVEMFRCMFYLPPGAFVSTWTQNVPHIG